MNCSSRKSLDPVHNARFQQDLLARKPYLRVGGVEYPLQECLFDLLAPVEPAILFLLFCQIEEGERKICRQPILVESQAAVLTEYSGRTADERRGAGRRAGLGNSDSLNGHRAPAPLQINPRYVRVPSPRARSRTLPHPQTALFGTSSGPPTELDGSHGEDGPPASSSRL